MTAVYICSLLQEVVLILLSFLLLMTAVCVLFYRKWFWYCYHSSHWWQLCIYVLFYRKWLWYCYHSSHWWQLCIYERLRNRSGSTNMPGYIMTSNFNLRIHKQAWFHCDVKLSQTCLIRSHKRVRFCKETKVSFHLTLYACLQFCLCFSVITILKNHRYKWVKSIIFRENQIVYG
jgi:hypothetical protein